MTVNRGPGVRQIGAMGTTPKEHRLAIAGQYAENAPGMPRSGLLVQAATNVVTPTASMSYNVAPVASVIARTVGEGVYTPTTTGTTTVATGNAPASGSRWDLIWIKQNDQEKGDKLPELTGVLDNSAVLGVTSGTAAASPVKPTGTVPAGAMVLAEAQIFAGTATTTASPNTITQVFRHTAARGAPIPVRSSAERDEITAPALGQRIFRQATGLQVREQWNGTSWDHFGHSEWTFNQTNAGFASGIPFGTSALTNDTSNTTDSGFITAVGETLRVRDAGLYDITMPSAWSKPPTARAFNQIIDSSSGVTFRSSASIGEDQSMVSLAGVKLAAGTVLTPSTYVIFGAGANTWSGRICLTRIG